MNSSVKLFDMLQNKIETIMKSAETNTSLYEKVLRSFSYIYGTSVKIRIHGYRSGMLNVKRLPCLVISIGNLTAGGTGKTPFAIYTAQMLKNFGYSVCVISRGYKGLSEKEGGIVSNGSEILMDAIDSGDEPYLMATRLADIPVIIGTDRYLAGMKAIRKFNPDVIILDDAFQHVKLYRDINIVLLDAKRPFGNGFLIPRGTLREPEEAINRGNVFILTRSDLLSGSEKEKTISALKKYIHNKFVFSTTHEPYIKYLIQKDRPLEDYCDHDPEKEGHIANLKDLSVVAFSGIAQNEAFKDTVSGFGCNIIRFFEFRDHHTYSNEELNTILSFAKEKGDLCIVTTEKDYVKIKDRENWPVDLVVIGVRISFGNEEGIFQSYIKSQIERKDNG